MVHNAADTGGEVERQGREPEQVTAVRMKKSKKKD